MLNTRPDTIKGPCSEQSGTNGGNSSGSMSIFASNASAVSAAVAAVIVAASAGKTGPSQLSTAASVVTAQPLRLSLALRRDQLFHVVLHYIN